MSGQNVATFNLQSFEQGSNLDLQWAISGRVLIPFFLFVRAAFLHGESGMIALLMIASRILVDQRNFDGIQSSRQAGKKTLPEVVAALFVCFPNAPLKRCGKGRTGHIASPSCF